MRKFFTHLNFKMDCTGPKISSCAINMSSYFIEVQSVTTQSIMKEKIGMRNCRREMNDTVTSEKTVG